MGSNLTQSEFATLVKSSQGTISKCESGKAAPSLQLCRNIHKCTGMDPLDVSSERKALIFLPGLPEPSSPQSRSRTTRLHRYRQLHDFDRYLRTRSAQRRKWIRIRDHIFAGASIYGFLKQTAIQMDLPGPVGEADLPFLIASLVTYILLMPMFMDFWSFYRWRQKA